MSFLKTLFGSKSNPPAARKTPPPGKFASAYRFPDRMVVHSQARLPGWALISCEPFLALPRDADAESAGRAVRTALAGFRGEIPDPDNLKEVTAAFVRGIGAKTHKQMQETAIRCGIFELDNQLEFQPYHNGGTSGDTKGFRPITEAKFSLPANSSPAEIGAALLRCFTLCTSVYDQA